MKKLIPFIFILCFGLAAYSQTATVISENANLRGTPTTRGKIVATLSRDDKVEMIKQKGAWFLVQSSTDIGWVHGSTIRLDGSSVEELTVPPIRLNQNVKLGNTDSNSTNAESELPPTKPGPMPKTISGGVLNSKATILPLPPYPAAAKAVRASGSVSVQVLIDESGVVISAIAVSGHPLLREAAEVAARQARFAPTLLSGEPVKVSGVITYNFSLD